MMNLNDLAKQSLIIAQRRKLKTDVLSVLKHCAGEVIEACEADCNFNKTGEQKDYVHLGEELADIIVCVLTASAEEEIDIEKALNDVMQKNARRAYETA